MKVVMVQRVSQMGRSQRESLGREMMSMAGISRMR